MYLTKKEREKMYLTSKLAGMENYFSALEQRLGMISLGCSIVCECLDRFEQD
jgi:hypothetical protein